MLVVNVLLFSANMIHRGLYGKNRLALDILYCGRHSTLSEFIQLKHQPSAEMLSDLDKSLFLLSTFECHKAVISLSHYCHRTFICCL
jgi:hypothetical protein